MRTYRLTIQSQDLSSVNLVSSASPWVGFSTIKALRGATVPLLIPRGNESYIIEQFGPPSDINPDVQEIIDFNVYYPIYVSAPPGIDDAENDNINKLGALFISENGLYNSYIKPSEEDAPIGRALFSIAGTNSSVTTKAFNVENQGSYPSIYMQLAYISAAKSPAILAPGSLVKSTLNGASDSTFIKAIVGEAWDAEDAVDNNLTLPAGVAPGEDVEVYFLRNYSTGVAGALVGAIWLDSSGVTPVIGAKIYMAFANEADPNANPQTSVWGTTAADLLHIDNAFFDEFIELATYTMVDSEVESVVDAIAVVYQKFPTATKTTIGLSLIAKHVAESTNVFNLAVSDWPSRYINIATRSYTISLDEDQVDGYGTSQYIEDVITDDRVIKVKYLAAEAWKLKDIPVLQTLSSGAASYDLEGNRVLDAYSYNTAGDLTEIGAALEVGWEEAKASAYDNVALFFEPRGLTGLNSVMSTLRSIHQFSRIVQPACRGLTTVAAMVAARTSYANNHGLAYPINEVLTREARTKTAWWRVPVGAYCVNLMDIMRLRNGAAAPMFENENGLGGQIDVSYEDIRIKSIDVEDQEELDATGFNTLIFDPDFGLMYINQRTGQNPDVISDSSWLAHDMAFDLFKRRVYKEVQFPQLGKPIDAQYIGIRTRQLNSLAGQFGNAFNAVRVEVDSVNTQETRAQRKFIMATAVQVTPFSEFVDFYFYNVGQTASVDDPFAGL